MLPPVLLTVPPATNAETFAASVAVASVPAAEKMPNAAPADVTIAFAFSVAVAVIAPAAVTFAFEIDASRVGLAVALPIEPAAEKPIAIAAATTVAVAEE